MYKIYKITNNINDKLYIGYTSQTLEKRFKRHLRSSKENKLKIHRAINLHGADNFSIHLIMNIPTLQEAKLQEIHHITIYNSYHEGYNSTKGGDYLPPDATINSQKTKSLQQRKEAFQKWLDSPEGLKFKENQSEMFKKLKPQQFVTKEGLIRAAKKYQQWLLTPDGIERRKQSASNMKKVQLLRHNGFYEFENPDGQIVSTQGNILSFCTENNLSFHSLLYAVHNNTFFNSRGKNKGWKILQWNVK